jgi:hypothetical protein
MIIQKTSEKVLIWLHRTNKSQVWLSEQLGCTRQALSTQLSDNSIKIGYILKIKELGCPLD